MKISGKRIICDPVGHCIYCGETSNLTLEHVAPFSLGGTMELPQASCKLCAKETGRFEGVVARGMLHAFRTKFNAPTRRPKERPNLLPLTVTESPGVERETIMLTVADHPATFVLPVLSPPRLITGITSTERHQMMAFWTWFPSKDIKKLNSFGGDGFKIGSVQINAFVRFLAKMAHAYSTAAQGHDSFIPLLTPLIRGQTEDYANYIGGRGRKERPKEMGEFSFQNYKINVNGLRYLGCEIDFLPHLGAPNYNIIVGVFLKDAEIVTTPVQYFRYTGSPFEKK